MAKAIKESRSVVTTVVTLSLSEEEAQTMMDIMASIGGEPSKSRRKHADAVSDALRSQGYRYTQENARGYATPERDYNGAINFKEVN